MCSHYGQPLFCWYFVLCFYTYFHDQPKKAAHTTLYLQYFFFMRLRRMVMGITQIGANYQTVVCVCVSSAVSSTNDKKTFYMNIIPKAQKQMTATKRASDRNMAPSRCIFCCSVYLCCLFLYWFIVLFTYYIGIGDVSDLSIFYSSFHLFPKWWPSHISCINFSRLFCFFSLSLFASILVYCLFHFDRSLQYLHLQYFVRFVSLLVLSISHVRSAFSWSEKL